MSRKRNDLTKKYERFYNVTYGSMTRQSSMGRIIGRKDKPQPTKKFRRRQRSS